jgi:hypothetical protein
MRLTTILLATVVASFINASANAAIILQLIIDPVADADAGIAPVNGMSVTSTRMGPGTWHVYALDNDTGSHGISSYNIFVQNATTVLHRSPATFWNDVDENGPFNAGFTLLRSINNLAPIGTLQASQPLPGSQPALIAGFGQTAGNFPDAISGEDPGGYEVTTSGQWGNYAVALNLPNPSGLKWIFLGEGQYAAGSPPSVGSAAVVTYFNENFASLAAQVQIAPPCFVSCPGGDPSPLINDASYPVPPDRNASDPANNPFTHQFTLANAGTVPGPVIWDNLQFVSYTPGFGGAGSGPDQSATVNASGLFGWNMAGSPRGTYVWSVQVSNSAGTDMGTISIQVNQVPEPASFALFGVGLIVALGFDSHRPARA